MIKKQPVKKLRVDWWNITAKELRDCKSVDTLSKQLIECARCQVHSCDDMYFCGLNFILCGDCRYFLRSGKYPPRNPQQGSGGWSVDPPLDRPQFNGRQRHQYCRSEQEYRISRQL